MEWLAPVVLAEIRGPDLPNALGAALVPVPARRDSVPFTRSLSCLINGSTAARVRGNPSRR